MIYTLIGPLSHSSTFDTIKGDVMFQLLSKTQFTIHSSLDIARFPLKREGLEALNWYLDVIAPWCNRH